MDLRQPDDSVRMQGAISWCLAKGLPVRRVSAHQLKVEVWNVYPDKDTFYRDDVPVKRHGFPAFQEAVMLWWGEQLSHYRT
jgi:hypothetical protein